MISIIAAVAENNVIGVKNGLPWKLSGDLKHFAQVTKSKNVLMGRNTFFSIKEMIGGSLPGRKSIVLSDIDETINGARIIKSWQEALDLAKNEEIFVIGGASVYKQALPYAKKLYITRVAASPEGDAYFPEIPEEKWQRISEEKHQRDEKNEFDYTFTVYERK